MNTFEWKNGKLYHYRNGELCAVIEAAYVNDYRQFVPECPEVAHVDGQTD